MGNSCYYLLTDISIMKYSKNQGYTTLQDFPSWDIKAPGEKAPKPGSHLTTFDLAARDAGGSEQLVVSFRDRNRLGWFSSADGSSLDEAPVQSPKGVDIDNNGAMVVISDNRVVTLTRANKTPVELIAASFLDSPFRISIDRSSGDILIAEDEHGAGQQVKRFSSTGQLLNTYGRKVDAAMGCMCPLISVLFVISFLIMPEAFLLPKTEFPVVSPISMVRGR